jgi:hypothetical protein
MLIQFGECNAFDGQCHCPDGWGGIDCLTPRKCPGQSIDHFQQTDWISSRSSQCAGHWLMPMHGIHDQTGRSVNAKKAGVESTATVRSSASSVDAQDMI